MSRRSERSLAGQVQSTAFVLVALVVAMVLATVGNGVVFLRSHDDAGRAIGATRNARLAHQAMLDMETGVRGYLLGRMPRFLTPYERGREALVEAHQIVAAAVTDDEQLVEQVISVRLAADRWMTEVAIVGEDRRLLSGAELTTFLDRSTTLFDAYRTAEALLVEGLVAQRDEALTNQRRLIQVGVGLQIVLLIGIGATVVVHRRRLRSGLVAPVQELERVIDLMRSGELGARVRTDGFTELQRVSDGLAQLGDSLANEQGRAQLRADLLASQADRFRELLRTSREISGNLSLRYVVDAICGAARRLTGWSTARVHLIDEMPLPPHLQEVAATGASSVEPGRAAFAMVVGGVVVGVLECVADDGVATVLSEELLEVLSVLAGQAAASVEAARLHGRLAEESRLDPLTGLANRRSLDEDLRHELDRSRRYGRPLSMLMLDVDHFKSVNDQHGHAVGDAVLRSLTDLLGPQLRSTDSAYRFGGEEFVVLLRETPLSAAADVAERIRRAIERRGASGLPVTASLGVVQLGHDDDAVSLFARADAALYQAKSEGRNRSVVDPTVNA